MDNSKRKVITLVLTPEQYERVVRTKAAFREANPGIDLNLTLLLRHRLDEYLTEIESRLGITTTATPSTKPAAKKAPAKKAPGKGKLKKRPQRIAPPKEPEATLDEEGVAEVDDLDL